MVSVTRRAAARINEVTQGQLNNKDNSAYELGFDFGQIFAFKQHSFGLVVMRCVLQPYWIWGCACAA